MTTPATPDQVRTARLRAKLERTLFNTCAWWGVGPNEAALVLDDLGAQVRRERRIGNHPWPDLAEANYNPGTRDDAIRELAYEAVAVMSALGVRPSARNVWRRLKEGGVRKRQSTALRIIGSVVSSLASREVAGSYVRGI